MFSGVLKLETESLTIVQGKLGLRSASNGLFLHSDAHIGVDRELVTGRPVLRASSGMLRVDGTLYGAFAQ